MISKPFLITKALYVPLMVCVQENLGRSVGPPSSPTSLESDNQVRYSKVSVGHFNLSGWDQVARAGTQQGGSLLQARRTLTKNPVGWHPDLGPQPPEL